MMGLSIREVRIELSGCVTQAQLGTGMPLYLCVKKPEPEGMRSGSRHRGMKALDVVIGVNSVRRVGE